MIFARNTALLFGFLMSTATTNANALVNDMSRNLALAPGTSSQMQDEADNKMLISVTSVKPLLGQPAGCITNYMAEAIVVTVDSGEFLPGDVIEFKTYHYDASSTACEGFTGPSSPPMLEEGWCGVAYLNDGSSCEAPLELAANGNSLVEEGNECATVGIPATQNPTPVNNGGSRKLALAPGTSSQMQDEAQNKMLISVTSVESELGQPAGCVTNYMAKAIVVTVDSGNHQPGDVIEFKTYYYDASSSECEGFTGPSSPPMMEEGWCGVAYLNDGSRCDSTLQLAANGDSLVEEGNECATVGIPETFAPSNEGSTRRLRGSN